MSDWKPIETAPESGSVLLFVQFAIGEPLIVQASWYNVPNKGSKGWVDKDGWRWREATHWMPIPDPPKGIA